MLTVFPELWTMPLNAPVVLKENFIDWAQLGEIYYRKATKFFKDWENGVAGKFPAHPRFVTAWVKELTEANLKKERESDTHESLTVPEMLHIGEGLSPGFYQYADRHSALQVFGKNGMDYFIIRISERKLYILNLRSGTRRINLGENFLEFPDLLASLPKKYTIFDTRDRPLQEATVNKAFSIDSIEDMERYFERKYPGRKIGSLGFQDGSGKFHRLAIPLK